MLGLPARIVLLTFVSLSAMEIAARTEDWVRYGTDWLSPFRDQSELIARDADGVHGRANARFQKWVMDSLGFRGPEADRTPAPGTLRVVTAGASETFGLYESERREYPRQLQDTLNLALHALGCSGDHRVEVLNSAMPGMSLPTVTQDVRSRLRRFAPAVVIYYPTPPQYLDEARPTAAAPDSSTVEHVPSWQARARPRILDRFREQAKGLLPQRLQDLLRQRMIKNEVAAHEPGWRFERIPADRLDAFEADLRDFVGSVRSIGAEPVLATHENAFVRGAEPDLLLLRKWQRFYPRATGRTILAFDEAAAERTRRVARDSAVALADIRGRVSANGFADYAHFNDVGAGQVAAAMMEPVLAGARRAGRIDCTGGPVR